MSKVQCPMSAVATTAQNIGLKASFPRKADVGPWTLTRLFDYLKINPLRRRAMFLLRQRIVSYHLNTYSPGSMSAPSCIAPPATRRFKSGWLVASSGFVSPVKTSLPLRNKRT